MKTSSAKNKGRRACQEAKEAMLKATESFGLVDDDIRVTSSGSCGEDLLLSPRAREIFPFAIECKNQESLNIWKACAQAEEHAKETERFPVVIFRRNNEPLRVVISLKHFLKWGIK